MASFPRRTTSTNSFEVNVSPEEEQPAASQPVERKYITWAKVFVTVVIVVLAVVLAFTLHLERYIPELLAWVETHRLLGSAVFVGFYTIWTVLCLPGLLLTLGAGAVLDPFWWAVLIVWIGAVCGQMLAFLLGRYLLRDLAASHARKRRLWHALEKAIQEEGWKITFLLRLAVVIPFDALNYGFALTPISFQTYAFTSAAGIVPGVLMYCYLGHMVRDMGQIMSGEAKLDPVSTAISLALSGAALAAAVALITIYTKRALKRMLPPEEEPLESDRTVLLDHAA